MNFDERDDLFSNEYDEADDDTQADDSFESLQDRAASVGALLYYTGADYKVVEGDGITTHYPETLARLQEVIEELENQDEQDAVQGTLSDDEMTEQDIEAERDEYLEEESENEDPEDESGSPQALGRTIERGVLFLTENFPGWHTYVDLNTLDVASAYECPLAQASRQGDFLLGYYKTDVSPYERHAHAQRHGFLDGDAFSDSDLNMGWQVAVRILRLTR